MLFFIGFFFYQAQAFNLISSLEFKFPINEVTYNVAGDGSCANAGFTSSELLDLTENAMELHWNSVPTSALVLVRGKVLPIDASADPTPGQTALRAGKNTIVIGCNNTVANFIALNPGDPVAAGIAQSVISGKNLQSGVLINAHFTSPVSGLSRFQLLALIAHEMGHAVGLDHSEYSTALMYFNIAGEGRKIQERLSIDDYDGVTYLYPYDNLFASCGTITATSSKDKHIWSSSLLLGIIMVLLSFGLFSFLFKKQALF